MAYLFPGLSAQAQSPLALSDGAFSSTVHRPTSVTLPKATGGTAPYTYALTGPNGEDVGVAVPELSFDPSIRVLSGTPTVEGETTLTYTATDSATTPASVSASYVVTVTKPSGSLSVDTPENITVPLEPVVGGGYSAVAAEILPPAFGGTPPYTYALTGPNGVDLSEVPGLSFDPNNRLTWIIHHTAH